LRRRQGIGLTFPSDAQWSCEAEACDWIRVLDVGFSIPSNGSRVVERNAEKQRGPGVALSGGVSRYAGSLEESCAWLASPYRQPHQESEVSSLWQRRRKVVREFGKLDS